MASSSIDWDKILDPTDIRFILFFSFISYVLSYLYAKYVTPHIEQQVNLEERTRDRIIKNRNEREKKSKEALEKLKHSYMTPVEEDEDTMEKIVEEKEDDEEDEDGAESQKKEKAKKKKKANKNKKDKAKVA